MSNTRKAANGKPKPKPKTYKFQTFRKEAEKANQDREPRVELPPFVIDDVQPPIVITAPDTLERQLTITELSGPSGMFDVSNALPLLRALCGDQFGRIWYLIKDDKDPDTLIQFIQAILSHFEEAVADLRAADEDLDDQGGSSDSSD